MHQNNEDKLGYGLRIKRNLLNIDHAQELNEENRKLLYSFQKKIASNLSSTNKVRSLGQQQKLLMDAFIVGKILGKTSFSSLLEKKENFLAFETTIREKQNWQENTKNQRLMSLKQVLKVCFEVPDWLGKIRTGKVGHTKPLEHEMLSPEEMLRIIEVAPTPKERAIFALLREGLRPAELLRLNFENISFDSEGRVQIQVIESKTGIRSIPSRRGAIFLRQWLDAHPFKRMGSALFPTAHETRMSYEQANLVNNRTMERAGTNPARSRQLYNWRKSSITNFLRSGGKSREASARYGTSLAQIEKSYDSITKDDLNASADLDAGITPSISRAPMKDLPKKCARCGAENESFKEKCFCGWNLEEKNPIMAMETQMEKMKEEIRLMSAFMERKLEPMKKEIGKKEIQEIIADN